MDINELLGYELTCKMSNELKDLQDYYEGEFTVIINEDSSCEDGYSAIVKCINDGKVEELKWEIEPVMNNLGFMNWEIIRKKRI
ncbi:hypothetical protein P5E62_14590 [Clostridium perfringens]|nr:hypothetical protein [Clostridium perfringens]MDK0713365.1 hypothetical protein [Clostridium perfringens]